MNECSDESLVSLVAYENPEDIAFIHENINQRPVIKAMNMNNKSFTLFLDTGSPRNIMDFQTYKAFFSCYPLEQMNLKLFGLGKKPLNVLGKINIKFRIGRFVLRDSFIIINNVNMHPIVMLGYPSIGTHNIAIVPAKNGIFIQGHYVRRSHSLYENKDRMNESQVVADESEPISMVHEYDNNEILKVTKNNIIRRVTLCNSVTLNSNSSTFVPVTIYRSPSSEFLLLENTSKVKGISATQGLYSTNLKGNCDIELFNHFEKPLHLKKGTFLFNAEVYHNPIMTVALISNNSENTNIISKEITEKINNEVESIEAKGKLNELLLRYSDLFSTPEGHLGKTDVIKHEIKLIDPHKVIYVPSYRLPVKFVNEIDNAVSKMLEDGVIQKSTSPYNFPLLCVPKKDATWRICVDFRKLNNETIPDRFPVPCTDDIISTLGKHTYFTSLDLLKGFHQIEMDPESTKYVAFSTKTGHYEYVRMPFGLRNAPITFTRMIQLVFGDLLGSILICYMDDIIICSDDLADHLRKLELVLERLRAFNLKVKLSKCNFYQTQLEYLGYIISKDGLKVIHDKVTAISNFPVPKSVKNIQQFLGVAGYYRRFIFRYSTIAAPLTDLLRKDIPFIWGEPQQSAFDKLKEALLQAPILLFPDFSKPFFLATDASNEGIGSALMQWKSNKLHPIAFYSRKLRTTSPNETNLSTIDKEALAIVNSLTHFKYIIYGFDITVLTDHKPLCDFFRGTQLTPKRTRWQIIIQEFNAIIRYVPGKVNVLADALSRNPLHVNEYESKAIDKDIFTLTGTDPQDNPSPPERRNDFIWDSPTLISEQRKDDKLKKILDIIQGSPDNKEFKQLTERNYTLVNDILCRNIPCKTRSAQTPKLQIVVPQSLTSSLLEYFHDHKSSAHPGVAAMYAKMKNDYFWKGMYTDIVNYIKKCLTS